MTWTAVQTARPMCSEIMRQVGHASVTPQTGGVLSATIADGRVAGQHTEVFGQGDVQVTFVFTFEATLTR